jgi:hypothetical protein
LEIFWGKADTGKCQEIIFRDPRLVRHDDNASIDDLGNMITLTKQAHFQWS